jgi:hypothetical protein
MTPTNEEDFWPIPAQVQSSPSPTPDYLPIQTPNSHGFLSRSDTTAWQREGTRNDVNLSEDQPLRTIMAVKDGDSLQDSVNETSEPHSCEESSATKGEGKE